MQPVTYNTIPDAIQELLDRQGRIEQKLNLLLDPTKTSDRWMSLDELCAYVPGGISKQTVYKKTYSRQIPHSKQIGKLMFLKSEIDTWLASKSRETIEQVQANAGRSLKPKSAKK